MIYSSTNVLMYCLHVYLSTVDPNPSTLSIDVSTTLALVYTFYNISAVNVHFGVYETRT